MADTSCRYVVDIASIRGGRVPIDPESLQGQAGRNSAVRHFFREDGVPPRKRMRKAENNILSGTASATAC